MKKMVLIAGILVVSGSMYSMDKDDNKGGGNAGKYSFSRKSLRRHRGRRITNKFDAGDLAKKIIKALIGKEHRNGQ